MAKFILTGQGIRGGIVEASTIDDAVENLVKELYDAGCREIPHRIFGNVAYVRGYMLGATNNFRDFTIREYKTKEETKEAKYERKRTKNHQ